MNSSVCPRCSAGAVAGAPLVPQRLLIAARRRACAPSVWRHSKQQRAVSCQWVAAFAVGSSRSGEAWTIIYDFGISIVCTWCK
jgi:hypothetical protein